MCCCGLLLAASNLQLADDTNTTISVVQSTNEECCVLCGVLLWCVVVELTLLWSLLWLPRYIFVCMRRAVFCSTFILYIYCVKLFSNYIFSTIIISMK